MTGQGAILDLMRLNFIFIKHEDRRISIIGGLILAGLTLTAGISVYVVMQQQEESLLRKNLETALQSNERLFKSEMNQALSNTRSVTTRPYLIQTLQLLESEPNNAKVPVELQRSAKSFLQTGFTAFSFYDVGGHEVARAGHFSQQHDLRVPLKTKNRAFLLWDGQFILHASMDVLDEQGRRVGTVMTETDLPLLTDAFADMASIGKTGEFGVCVPLADDEKNMDCFLSRTSGIEFKRLARVIEGKPLPMNHALNGESGILFAKDYRREQVVAAYAPVGAFGLGMVVKIDQAELYQPVIEQLKFIAPLLAALVIVGMLLLNFLVRPLVRKLVDSERAARDANALLRISETRFTNIVNMAVDAIISVDQNQHILNFNQGAERIFGYTAAEVAGQPLDMLLPVRFAETHSEYVHRFATGPDTARDMNHRRAGIHGRRRDGTEFPAEASISSVNENGNLRLTVFLRDITELKRIDRMKSEFISTASHELRTPLTAIYASLDMLHSGMAGELPPDVKELLSISHNSAGRLVRLINDVLDVEQIESRSMFYDKVVQPLLPLVEQAITATQSYADQYQVKFELSSGSTDAPVRVDADRVIQVLVNLLSNAAKFSPAGGAVVSVNLRQLPDCTRVSVTDSGSGIPGTFRDRIFQRFAQVDSSDRRQKGGSGLGLYLCKSIIESHQGTIDFFSDPGKGCEFYFDLPLAAQA